MTAFTEGFNAGTNLFATINSIRLREKELKQRANEFDKTFQHMVRQQDFVEKQYNDKSQAAENIGNILRDARRRQREEKEKKKKKDPITEFSSTVSILKETAQHPDVLQQNPAALFPKVASDPAFQRTVSEKLGWKQNFFQSVDGSGGFKPTYVPKLRGFVFTKRGKDGRLIYMDVERSQNGTAENKPPLVIPEDLAAELATDYVHSAWKNLGDKALSPEERTRVATALSPLVVKDTVRSEGNPLAAPPPLLAREAPEQDGVTALAQPQALVNQALTQPAPSAEAELPPDQYLDTLLAQVRNTVTTDKKVLDEARRAVEENMRARLSIARSTISPWLRPLTTDVDRLSTPLAVERETGKQADAFGAKEDALGRFEQGAKLIKAAWASPYRDTPGAQQMIAEALTMMQDAAKQLGIPFDPTKFGVQPLDSAPAPEQAQQSVQSQPVQTEQSPTPQLPGVGGQRMTLAQPTPQPQTQGLSISQTMVDDGLPIPEEAFPQFAKNALLMGVPPQQIVETLARGKVGGLTSAQHASMLKSLASMKKHMADAEKARFELWKDQRKSLLDWLAKANKETRELIKDAVDMTASYWGSTTGEAADSTKAVANEAVTTYLALTNKGGDPLATLTANPTAYSLVMRNAAKLRRLSDNELPPDVAVAAALANVSLGEDFDEALASVLVSIMAKNPVAPTTIAAAMQQLRQRAMELSQQVADPEALKLQLLNEFPGIIASLQ